jgi:SAM-dependent methyltransferase
MHETAYAIGGTFFGSYVRAGDRILEIGSMNINGSLRDFCPGGSRYVGADLSVGPGVDVVVGQTSDLPFAADTFDAVVSSSCFEHDGMFWVTFLEICRVLKQGGYLYINAPSRGVYHRYPIDAWRFFPDSGIALCGWAKANNHAMNLLESFIALGDDFDDCVMIFGKRATPPSVLVAERYTEIINLRAWPDLETLDRQDLQWPDAGVKAQLSEAREQLSEALRERAEAKAALAAVLDSTSWRLMAPVRRAARHLPWLGRAARRLAGAGQRGRLGFRGSGRSAS